MGVGKKMLKRNVVPIFEDLKEPVAENKRKPPAARKSLFEEIGGLPQEQMNTKFKKHQRLFALIVVTIKKKLTKF